MESDPIARRGSQTACVGCPLSMRTLSLAGLVLPLAAAAGQPLPSDSTAASIDRLIRARAEADSFSGAVLVAKNGTPVLRAGYGLADRERRVPARPDTRFNLGSLDKLITRVAVWQP